jgi:hypothetical protein
MVVICNLHFDIGGKGQIEMEGVESGSELLDRRYTKTLLRF